MEIAYILKELWKRKQWVALAFLVACAGAIAVTYRVEFLPPAIHEKSLSFGTANTQVFVDAPASPVATLSSDFAPLIQRSAVYAQLLQSKPVLDLIGKKIGVPGSAIAVAGPSDIRPVQSGRNVGSEQRATEITAESAKYRIFSSPSGPVPVVAIATQAATARDAIRLANAAAQTLVEYVLGYEGRDKAAPEARVDIRQLGPATGGTIARGANRKLGGLALIAFFFAACGLVLLVSHVVRNWRTFDPMDPRLPAPHPNGRPVGAAGVPDLPRQPVGDSERVAR